MQPACRAEIDREKIDTREEQRVVAGADVAPNYEDEQFEIEKLIGKQLPPFSAEEDTVLVMLERVSEAQRMAAIEMREKQADRQEEKANSKRAKMGKKGKKNNKRGGGSGAIKVRKRPKF